MTPPFPDSWNLRTQLSLYLPAVSTPPLEGATRDAVVRLLAQLLTSACRQDVGGEGRDERR